jgi:undecaprenyl-diphosphatase
LPYLTAAFLGVVQGLTEFLPVSSTAHLLLAGRALAFDDPAFIVMIQLGSIVAVVWLYREKLWRVASRLHREAEARRFALMLFLAFVPAVVAGGLLSDFVTSVLYDSPGVFAVAFIVGGLLMLLVERLRPDPNVYDPERTPLGRAFGIGMFQMLALVPGVSRSGATIVGGLIMGLERSAAAEFSFFLAIPTLTAAFGKSLLDVWSELSVERTAEIVIGFVCAFLASIAVMRPFVRFVGRSGFAPFAWYRIVLGVGILAALYVEWL